MIDRVTLRVSDVERSAEFYARLVGLIPTSVTGDRATLADPAAPDEVRLKLTAAEQPGRAPIAAAGLYHVAYLYPDRAALGAALRRIFEGSYEFIGAADHGVSEALYLQDPDNLGIELYRDRPRSEWPMDGDRIAMFTAPLALEPIAAESAEGSDEETAGGMRVGHVHLRSSDLEVSKSFWTGEAGLDLMAELPGAAFLAAGGYHHHIGVNTWQSAGAEAAPRSGPGLEAITFGGLLLGVAGNTPEGVTLGSG